MFGRIKKDIKEEVSMLREWVARVEKGLDQIQTNGVATSIDKLNQEVFKKVKETNSTFSLASRYLTGEPAPKEATLASKVDAIVEHLGLEFNVEAEKVSVKKTKKGRK